MYLAYIEESGDPGFPKRDKSKGEHYSLSALLIRDTEWLATLNRLIAFRRYLSKQFGIRMGEELKGSHFVFGSKAFERLGLGEDVRMRIYRMSLKLEPKLPNGLWTWAVVFKKAEWEKTYPHFDLFTTAWQNMIERLERFTDREKHTCIVFPDEGSRVKIRSVMRQLRRFSRPQSAYAKIKLERNAELILEDPNFRQSHDSYFVQLADFNAYASARAVYPKPWCDESYWDLLGNIRDDGVNAVTRPKGRNNPIGIAVKP